VKQRMSYHCRFDGVKFSRSCFHVSGIEREVRANWGNEEKMTSKV
jgi:hypothetical protein